MLTQRGNDGRGDDHAGKSYRHPIHPARRRPGRWHLTHKKCAVPSSARSDPGTFSPVLLRFRLFRPWIPWLRQPEIALRTFGDRTSAVYCGDETTIPTIRLRRHFGLRRCLRRRVRRELELAPESVNRHFKGLLPLAHLASISEEALALQKAYIDALHVALATVGGCEMIVSW